MPVSRQLAHERRDARVTPMLRAAGISGPDAGDVSSGPADSTTMQPARARSAGGLLPRWMEKSATAWTSPLETVKKLHGPGQVSIPTGPQLAQPDRSPKEPLRSRTHAGALNQLKPRCPTLAQSFSQAASLGRRLVQADRSAGRSPRDGPRLFPVECCSCFTAR